jgi:hypothetical protein
MTGATGCAARTAQAWCSHPVTVEVNAGSVVVIEWMATHPRARTAVLVTAGLVAGLVLLAFILAGIDRVSSSTAGERDTDPQSHPSVRPAATDGPSPSAPPTPAHPPPSTEEGEDERSVAPLPDLPDTDDPDVYAAAVAGVLFGMDYANHAPGDYEAFFDAALWEEIVPDARMRVMTTLSRRIPTADMWEQMRLIDQTSEFEVELVWEPRTGRDHREAGDWPDGVVTRNVSGTQTETWQAPEEEEQSSARPVAVTIAMACPPATSPCRLVGILPTVGT